MKGYVERPLCEVFFIPNGPFAGGGVGQGEEGEKATEANRQALEALAYEVWVETLSSSYSHCKIPKVPSNICDFLGIYPRGKGDYTVIFMRYSGNEGLRRVATTTTSGTFGVSLVYPDGRCVVLGDVEICCEEKGGKRIFGIKVADKQSENALLGKNPEALGRSVAFIAYHLERLRQFGRLVWERKILPP